MFPIVAVPGTIRRGMAHYRPLFCRAAEFEHVSRYVTGLILSPNKTLQTQAQVRVNPSRISTVPSTSQSCGPTTCWS